MLVKKTLDLMPVTLDLKERKLKMPGIDKAIPVKYTDDDAIRFMREALPRLYHYEISGALSVFLRSDSNNFWILLSEACRGRSCVDVIV